MSSTVTEKSLKSLFPTGEIAWSGMSSGVMREISDGLSIDSERNRQNGKSLLTDFYPYLTTLQKEWEDTFKLPSGDVLTVEQRTNRLIEAWMKKDTASFDSQNEIYALSGFDVVARPLRPGEDPRFLSYKYIFADGRQGSISKNYIAVCGVTRCGNVQDTSRCGAFQGNRINNPDIVIPDDQWTWPLVYVLEAENGSPAFILESQLDSFIFLTYKMKPQFMWAIARYETYTGLSSELVNDDGDPLVNDDGDQLVILS